jgi:hypothetical protein
MCVQYFLNFWKSIQNAYLHLVILKPEWNHKMFASISLINVDMPVMKCYYVCLFFIKCENIETLFNWFDLYEEERFLIEKTWRQILCQKNVDTVKAKFVPVINN